MPIYSHSDDNGGPSITRRQALQLALVAGGTLASGSLLDACADSTTSKQGIKSLSPTPRNQTLFIDQVQFSVFDSFNGFIPNGQEYEAGLGQICREYLFYYNMATGEIKPWLATKWAYNADYTQLTLSLNPAAHWSDGKPFTSEDVQFTINLLMGNAALAGSQSYTPFVKPNGVTTPDSQTVVFALTTPNPRFHYNFICGISSGQLIEAKHIWAQQDPTKFKNNPPIYTGPYKLDRVLPDQFMYIWKKDPNYWNKSNLDPKPEYIVYRSIPNSVDTEIDQFKRGQVDVTQSMNYTQAVSLQNNGYKNMVVVTKFRDPCPRSIAINSDPSKGLLSDPRMHWAISYLIDRKSLGATVWVPPTPPAQYPWADYASNNKWSNQDLASKYQLTYDPTKAAALLDEMGAKAGTDGKRTYQGQALQYEVMTSAQEGQPEYINAQKVADGLNSVGIGANVKYYEGSVWTNKLNQGNYDISTYWLCGDVFDPGQLYTVFEISKSKPVGQDASGTGNVFRAQYPELSDIAVKLDSADPTSTASKALFDQGLEAFYKYLPHIPVYQTTYASIFNTQVWTGWPTDEDVYQVPDNWWGQFLFVVAKLKPAQS